MEKITFCIPSKNNLRYLKACISSIRKNAFRKDHDIIIFVDSDNDGTVNWLESVKAEYKLEYFVNDTNQLYGIGKAYDFCVNKSKTDIFMIFHADMMLGVDADIELLKHLSIGKVVCSTRIEPPLHPEGPEKIVKDFGMWPEQDIKDGFQSEKFNEYVMIEKLKNDNVVTHGCFAPWAMYKSDFVSIGMHDSILKSAREDSDVFNRMTLKGYELIQSWQSFVYHLTCRGGQFEHGILTTDESAKSADWKKLMHNSTLEFIRKWGSQVLHDEYMKPIIHPRYNIGLCVSNCNTQLLSLLEPWCDEIHLSNSDIRDSYIKSEQKNTAFNLSTKIQENMLSLCESDIEIIFDARQFTRQDQFNFIQNLSQILTDSGEVGTFEYDIFKIKINRMMDHKDKLINIESFRGWKKL